MKQDGEKTEKPTPKKLRDARNNGQVIKSTEIIIGVQMLVVTLYFWFLGTDLIAGVLALIETSIRIINDPFTSSMQTLMRQMIELGQYFLGSLCLVLILATIVSAVAQFGVLFAPKAIQPSLQKISPLKNIKNIFSMRSLFELFKSILKITLLSVTFVIIFLYVAQELIILPQCGTDCALIVSRHFLLWLMMSLIVFYSVFSVADYLFQRHTTLKQLMMSRKEVLDEFKNMEGNPEIKQKRKQIHREIQSGSLSQTVGQATAVVKNPTHISICLYYERGETPLPMITEKGTEAKAQLIVNLAEKAQVPVVENVQVARQLMADTEIGDYIPNSLFAPVATILNTVMQLKAPSPDHDDDIESAEN